MIQGLTLRQPWAWLIAHGHKSIETRKWRPPEGLEPQWLAIHAGQTYGEDERGTAAILRAYSGVEVPVERHVLGAVVAVAELAEVRPLVDSFADGAASTVVGLGASDLLELYGRDGFTGQPMSGLWAWVLGEVYPVAPVKLRGQRRLWPVDAELNRRLRTAYHARRDDEGVSATTVR